MVKIKFTPFVSFLILLVVLVILVLFGYKNKIFEGATSYKPASYKKIATVNEKEISVDKSTGNILIKDTSGSSAVIIDSSGNEDDAKEALTTKMNAPDNASAFVYEDDNVIIPYVNYADDVYLIVIDPIKKEAVSAYTYAKGKENVDESIKGTGMEFKNVSSRSSGKSSGNVVAMSSDIEIDVDKNKFKKDGDWIPVRTKTPSKPQIIPSKDGSFVVSMEGSMSTSNYVIFSLYKKDNVINMDPVILKYDMDDTGGKGSRGKGSSDTDMSKYVPKTWLNPNGCPKCPSSGDCSKCGSSGTPGSLQNTGSGTGSNTPGSQPGFGNNLVNQTTGLANNVVGGATALGLGAELGATVLGASAVGGATSVGNNAIGGAAGLGNNAIGGATRLGQGVTNAAGNAVGAAGNVLNNTIGTAGGVVNNAVNKLTGLAGGLGSGVKDVLQSGNRMNLQQGQQGQQGKIGPNGQLIQGQGAQGQFTPYGQLIVQQPNGQQYAGYQFASPMFLPYANASVQTSNFSPIADQTGAAGISKGGNYF